MSLFTNAKTYELPLSRDYVRHWSLAEAVREMIQNALDSDSPFEYELNDGTLRIHSCNATLTPSTLLLGSTTKHNLKAKIGSFGEGYKIALLVLAREGRDVKLLNGDRVWTPEFQSSKQFDSEVLCIRDGFPDMPRLKEGADDGEICDHLEGLRLFWIQKLGPGNPDRLLLSIAYPARKNRPVPKPTKWHRELK